MSYYRISYTNSTERELSEQCIFKYIDSYVLYDLEYVKEITENKNPLDIDIEDHNINDRDTAAAYIKQHRQLYEYTGHRDTGRLARVLCVETDDRDKATGALYDHPEHGLIWLEM